MDTMDTMVLAKELSTFLSPFLPYLINASEKSAKEMGEKFGNEVWKQAKLVWEKIQSSVESKPSAQEAVQDVAKSPYDEDSLAVLRVQLKKLLKDDKLAREVADLLQEQVVQRVLAEQGSNVTDVEQTATGKGEIRQEVIARDKSTIKGVHQKKQ